MSGEKFAKFGVNFGKVGDADGVVSFLRCRHPSKTAERVGAEIGVSPDTARKWLDGAARPSFDAFARMISAYGPEFLAAAIPSLAWLSEASLNEQRRVLEDQIASAREKLSRLS